MPEEPPEYSYTSFVGWMYQSGKNLLGVNRASQYPEILSVSFVVDYL